MSSMSSTKDLGSETAMDMFRSRGGRSCIPWILSTVFFFASPKQEGNEVVYEHTNNSNDYFTTEMSGFLVHDGLLIGNNGRPVQREEQRTSLKKTWLKAEVRVWVQWVSYSLMPTQHFRSLTPPMGRLIMALMQGHFVNAGEVILAETRASTSSLGTCIPKLDHVYV